MIKMGMASFNVSMTLVLFALLCLSREAAASEYIYHSCSDKTTFTPNSTFQSNLHHLLSSLSSNATREDGFYSTTVSQSASDAVYGLFLCRGDLTVQDCQECVGNATQDLIRQYCPLGKEGVIWYEECMLRYSDQYFFSNMSMHPSVYVPSRRKVHDPDRFNHLLKATMKGLVSQVANVEIGAKKYATKEANFMGSQILYTLEQCTPDISSFACSMCIQQAIALLPNCCSGIEGARVMFPSCRNRKKKILIHTIILIVALISVSAVLFIMSYYFRCRRANIEYNAMDEGALQLDVATIELLPLKLLR